MHLTAADLQIHTFEDLTILDGDMQIVDSAILRNQQVDVSYGHYPDASESGVAVLSVVPDLCGFDPGLGQFERFNFLWTVNDVLDSSYRSRRTVHDFCIEDAGDLDVVITVFDTHTSVTRHDTVTVTVEAPAVP